MVNVLEGNWDPTMLNEATCMQIFRWLRLHMSQGLRRTHLADNLFVNLNGQMLAANWLYVVFFFLHLQASFSFSHASAMCQPCVSPALSCNVQMPAASPTINSL